MPLVVYSAQRLGLFVAALAALAAMSVGGWLLVVLAAVIAAILSYVLLGRSRDAAALWLHDRVSGRRSGRFGAGLAADAAAEDAAVDRLSDPGGQRAVPEPAAAQGAASQRETETQQRPVGELEQTGAGQDGAEQDPARAEQDGAAEQGGRQREQQHEQ